MNNVIFYDEECSVELGYYTKERKALSLKCIKDGTPMAVATINLPYIELEENEVIIKNYSENEGIDDVLIEAKIISKEPVFYVDSGYVSNIPVHTLL